MSGVGGNVYRSDGQRIVVVKRHWRDYPPPTPQPTPCRIWQGRLDKDGYGVFARKHNERVKVHRWVYEMANGPIPKGMVVRHKCDNPPCFRLTHLEIGTVADNNRDAQERGHLGPPLKISPSQMREMFELHSKGESNRALGRRYGVSEATIRNYIKQGRDAFPHVWGERIEHPKKPKPMKHSDWRNRADDSLG